jgi:hypothetical protein
MEEAEEGRGFAAHGHRKRRINPEGTPSPSTATVRTHLLTTYTLYIYMHVCIHCTACIHACMYACVRPIAYIHVCMHAHARLHTHSCMYACIRSIWSIQCIPACMHACIRSIWTIECIHACNACMHTLNCNHGMHTCNVCGRASAGFPV